MVYEQRLEHAPRKNASNEIVKQGAVEDMTVAIDEEEEIPLEENEV